MQLGDTTGSYQVRPATQTNQQPNTTGSTTPSNPAAAPPPASQSVDWTTDPIYQLVVGQQNLAIANAKAEALKQQTQALIAYGDPNLAMAVTGDQNVAEAARMNKASTLAQLVAGNKKNVRDINENENQQNLFYSSDRGYQLGLNQQAYLNNQANAYQGVQGQLGNIGTQLLANEQNAYQAEQQAARDAYNRAVQNPPGVGSSDQSTSASQPNNNGTSAQQGAYLSGSNQQAANTQASSLASQIGSTGSIPKGTNVLTATRQKILDPYATTRTSYR